jgi:hypothetical protein
MKTIALASCLIFLCATGATGAPAMKGVWLPIQAIPGYPHWNDFAAAEAAAAAQALMSVTIIQRLIWLLHAHLQISSLQVVALRGIRCICGRLEQWLLFLASLSSLIWACFNAFHVASITAVFI